MADLVAHFGARRRDDDGLDNLPPRFNGAPRQDYPLIINEPDVAGGVFTLANWGFVPRWMKDPKGGTRPINAKAESVASNGMFRNAYRTGRALMPIDGFFEWKAIRGEKAKQPYAIAMKDGEPFALAAIYDTWRSPATGAIIKTFAVITCAANDLMAEIHDRMPVIIAPENYARWLAEIEPDPADLLVPYPAELMTMWPVSRRASNAANNTPNILDRIEIEPQGE